MKLWLDDVRNPLAHGREGWTWIRTIADAKVFLKREEVSEASLDHDLGGAYRRDDGKVVYPSGMSHKGTGYDLVLWMKDTDTWPTEIVHVHSANQSGAERMLEVIRQRFPDASWMHPRGGRRSDGV